MAYQSQEGKDGTPEIYVQPFPATGAKFQITRDGGNHPVWSPDGKELFFMNNPPGGQLHSVSIRTQPSLSFGNPVALAIKGIVQRGGGFQPRSLGWTRNYDITPDGKQFIVVLPQGAATTDAPQPLQIQVVLNWFSELRQRVPLQ